MSKITKSAGITGLMLAICLFAGTPANAQCGDPDCTGCVETSCDTGCCDSGCRARPCRAQRVRGCGGCDGLKGCRAPREKCPRCSCEVCELKVNEVKAKKTCYQVEEEIICVPTPRFPWQRCEAPATCSPTLKVKRLKKHTYECPECEYEWNVVKPQVVQAEAEGASIAPQQPATDTRYLPASQVIRAPASPRHRMAPQVDQPPIVQPVPARQQLESGPELRAIINNRNARPQPQIDWTFDDR